MLTAIVLSMDKESEKYEELVRHLLEEDIIDRETNSFQGIGDSLYTAIFLLQQYQKESDNALYERAKDANFDTGCGLDIQYAKNMICTNINNFELSSCIHIATDLKEDEYHSQFVDIWKSQQNKWDKKNLSRLRYMEKDRNNNEGELWVLEKLAEISAEEDHDWDYCSAMHSLAQKQVEMGKTKEAWQTLSHIIPRIKKVEEWYSVGLGRFILEICADLISAFGADSEISKQIWKFAEPAINKIRKNMHWNLYQKAAEAANIMDNTQLSTQLQQQLEKEKKAFDEL